MATDAAKEAENAPADMQQQPAPAKRFGLGGKRFKILALLVVIMVGQAAALYLILPQPTGESAQGGEGVGAADGEASDKQIDTVEVKIDTFNSTNSSSPDGGVIHVTFMLYATVASDVQHPFQEAISSHRARVSQAIVKVIRMSSREDLRDPELNVVKRRIKEGVNKVLRKSYIKEVVISEFKTVEQ